MFVKNSIFDPERRQSAKKLKADDNFAPYPVNAGDEIYPNGIFEFNITKILKDIENNPIDFNPVEAVVDDFPKSFSSINESHMDLVEIARPVILAEISPGHYNLIDGNQRMEKARRIEVNNISAYKLNVEQHLKYLTSKDAYLSYIQYWNDKLR